MPILGALYPSKSGLIHKHIVKHFVTDWHSSLFLIQTATGTYAAIGNVVITLLERTTRAGNVLEPTITP